MLHVPEVRVVPFLVSELRLPPEEQELLDREWWPSYAHAVVHRDGVFLFDNGAGLGNEEIDRTFSPRVRLIEDALGEHGIALADVTAAANCHLHFDHSGQNVRLPGRPIFVQRAEWAMVHEPDYTVPEMIDAPGLSYEVLDGEAEVAPGLRLVPTPGHTAGHQSLVLDAAEGTIVLAGQAVQSRAEWEGATEPAASGASAAKDPAYPRSVERLRSFDPVRVHFAHDQAVWERDR
ncbi:MAG TPA: MBL fold metallo-hydrolase [Actinomycetota bacterium]|jgi:glyoxylase-like metal-dependent hydrolase (beta-lactamase superfamily II)